LIQSFCARAICGLFIALATLGLSSCHSAAYYYYKFPEFTFADRPIPPSKLANRVMVGLTANGSQGGLQILDASRDIRSTVEDPNKTFAISGYSAGYPSQIFNYPEETRGYVYSKTDGSLQIVNYSTEATGGSGGSLSGIANSIAVPDNFNHIYAAEQTVGQLGIIDNTTGRTYGLNRPNVYQVAVNQGDTVVLAMVRNSNTLYRLVKLNQNQFSTSPIAIAAVGAVDCQPFNLPVYCVVPVPGNLPGSTVNNYDRPVAAYFSLDGTTGYVLNCGAECGGTTSSISFIQQGLLTIDVIPTSPVQPTPVTSNVLVPGGATVALAGNSVAGKSTLYVAGQKLLNDSDGVQRFAGFLSTIDLATNTVTGSYSISDGNHSKLLFADDNTLWIGSQFCSTGERAHLGQNFNCLTRFDMSALTASIVPALTTAAPTVPYPNGDNNQYYYGSLTGLCWVQNLHKVYTAYGGQVHAFNTATGAEINNSLITIQGTALDVAYLDAVTNAAN
jgi:hypothetical protein